MTKRIFKIRKRQIVMAVKLTDMRTGNCFHISFMEDKHPSMLSAIGQ